MVGNVMVVIRRFFEVCYINDPPLSKNRMVVIRRFFEVCYINLCYW